MVTATVARGISANAMPEKSSTTKDININNNITSTTTSKKAKVTVSSYLNVRSAPSTESNVIGYVYSNEEVTINNINDSWANITYNLDNGGTKTGFVSTKYLSIESQNAPNPASPINQINKKGKINSNNIVYVAKDKAASNTYIGYVYPNEEITVNFIEDNLANITYNLDSGGTKTGFIDKDLVKFEVENINYNAKVIKNNVRVYKETSENSSLVGYVFLNEEVKINYSQNNWSNITYKLDNGGTKTGFVENSNLNIGTQSGSSESTPLLKKGKVINVSSSLRIRQAPNTDSYVVGYLSPNETFDILSKQGDWYKISFDTYNVKKEGYVYKDYVKEFIESESDNTLGIRITEYSKRFLGIPYVWGGTSPTGFDCSGLVYYVYSKFNITLGRSTWDQIKTGKRVEISAMKPGDLIFFGPKTDPNNPTHVGLYIGNGEFIQAPKPDDVVKITKLSNFNMNVIQANRYIE